jgi:hypothetical protein
MAMGPHWPGSQLSPTSGSDLSEDQPTYQLVDLTRRLEDEKTAWRASQGSLDKSKHLGQPFHVLDPCLPPNQPRGYPHGLVTVSALGAMGDRELWSSAMASRSNNHLPQRARRISSRCVDVPPTHILWRHWQPTSKSGDLDATWRRHHVYVVSASINTRVTLVAPSTCGGWITGTWISEIAVIQSSWRNYTCCKYQRRE